MSKQWSRVLAAVAAGVIGFGAVSVPQPEPAAASPATTAASQLARGFAVTSKATALAQARHLRVTTPGSMAGYSQTVFPYWRDASDNGWPKTPSDACNACNARNAALYRDGTGVQVNARCTITAGHWLDPYTGKTYTSKRSIQIDHEVARANAWRFGARTWTLQQRTRFANDPLVLVSVSGTANQAKGNKGPDAWRPPNKAAWCLYAKRYTAIKTKYHLTTTRAEQNALVVMIGTCTH